MRSVSAVQYGANSRMWQRLSITVQTLSPGIHVISAGARRATSPAISSVTACRRAAAACPRVKSAIESFLAEELQHFLDGPVGEREEHALVTGFVNDSFPARHDEDVARLPVDDEIRSD